MRKYIITGAAGHLAQAIIALLTAQNCHVYGLILPTERADDTDQVKYIHGDITDMKSLDAFFAATADQDTIVIHAAGIISIADEVSPVMYHVNVIGTRNVIQLCKTYQVKRLLYVSSVHALPELPKGQVMGETDHFDPALVHGGYAKTKAEASAEVMAATRSGLDAVLVHPSGIIGPKDHGGNHLNQLIKDYILGKLPAGVQGGYDFVDVRDVAQGCLLAAERGASGACYILSNKYYTIEALFEVIRQTVGGRKKLYVPLWLAKAALPFIGAYAKLTHTRALFTRYSLYTINSNAAFSHDKASRELGYRTRGMDETIADTAAWLAPQCPGKRRTRNSMRLAPTIHARG